MTDKEQLISWAEGVGPLFAAKVVWPRLAQPLHERPDLLRLLDEAALRPLTLVVAPAASGKTTLLAQWARRQARCVAWLTLDEADNDPLRFWHGCVAAVCHARPELEPALCSLLAMPRFPGNDVMLAALAHAVAALDAPLVLVLDDYHLVTTAAIQQTITMIVDRLSDRLRLIIATRTEPALPLARWRMRDQLAEMRAVALRWSEDDTACLLSVVLGRELPRDLVAELCRRTEGWIGGIHLAGLALRDAPDPQRFVAAFDGQQRDIVDFIVSEVLDTLPDDLRLFLLMTSILDAFDVGLCNAVTGRADSQSILEELERRALFVVPLDERRAWYRYQRLFADVLRLRLAAEQPKLLGVVHQRAAASYQAADMPVRAVQHALAADPAVAAELIGAYAPGLIARGELTTLLGWLERLPAPAVAARPRLGLAYAWALAHAGHLDAATRQAQAVELALVDARDPMEGRLEAELAAVRARIAGLRGDVHATIAYARSALALLGPRDARLRADVALNLGFALRTRQDIAAAEAAYAESYTAAGLAQHTRAALFATRYHAILMVEHGRLDRAETLYRDALARLEDRTIPASGMLLLGLAELAYEHDDLACAERYLREGRALGEQGGEIKTLVAAAVLAARLAAARGDLPGALSHLVAPHGIGTWSVLERWRVRFDGADDAAVRRWRARVAELPLEPGPIYDYLALARLDLAQGEPCRAQALLERLQPLIAPPLRGIALELYVLQALAHDACGATEQAHDALHAAIAIGGEQGFIRSFVDEGGQMRPLLQAYATRRGCTPYVERLLAACPVPAARPQMLPGSRPVDRDALTAREREVLVLLAAGQSNQEIARSLVLSLNTVKTHLRTLYDKLDAHSRTQVLVRARTQGILE